MRKINSKLLFSPLNPQNIKTIIKPLNPLKITKQRKKTELFNNLKIYPQNPQKIYPDLLTKKTEQTSNEKVRLCHLMLEITTRCNLLCKHCYNYSNSFVFNQLPFLEIEKIIEKIKYNNGESITLTGGEPLLHSSFDKIIDCLDYYEMPFTIFTNGQILDDNKIERLWQKGISSIQISIDGLKNTHDEFRGVKGSFARAMKSIEIAKNKGIKTIMMITIHEKNITEIESLINIGNKLEVDGITMNTYIPQGRASILNTLDESSIKSAYKNISINKCINDSESITACGVGYNKIAILANGNITPCEVMRDLVIGNISQNNIYEIFDNSLVMKELRDAEVLKIEGCKDCSIKNICKGGCKAYAWLTNKSFLSPDKRQCNIWHK